MYKFDGYWRLALRRPIPDKLAIMNLRVPPHSELPRLPKGAERVALTTSIVGLLRDLRMGRIRKADYVYGYGENIEYMIESLLDEIHDYSELAWEGYVEPLASLPELLKEYVVLLERCVGGTPEFQRDWVKVQDIADALFFIVQDPTAPRISDDHLKNRLRRVISRKGDVSQADGVAILKGFDPKLTRQHARRLVVEVTGNTKRGPRGPRTPKKTRKKRPA